MPPKTVYDAFFDKQLTGKWAPKPNQVNAIRDLFNGKIDAAAAAVKFTSDVNAATDKNKAQGGLWQIWKVVEDVCIKFPEKHDQLIEMLVAVSHLPDLVLKGETEPEIKWSEMPVFSWLWVEDILDWGNDHPFDERLNGIAFTAKVTGSSITALNFCDRAGQTLSETFERGPSTPEPGKLVVGLGAGSQRALEANLPFALQWLTYAGEKIYNSDIDFENFFLRPKGNLWEGQQGFGWERWNYWLERARWMKDEKKLSARARNTAADIVQVMEEIQNRDETRY